MPKWTSFEEKIFQVVEFTGKEFNVFRNSVLRNLVNSVFKCSGRQEHTNNLRVLHCSLREL